MRAALEEAKADLPGTNLKQFPKDCCDHASRLLLLHFEDNGVNVNGFEWIVADLTGDDLQRHVWLESNGIIVDITADQFAGRYPIKLEPVIVARHSVWHAGLNVKRESPGNGRETVAEFCSRLRNGPYKYREMYEILGPILNRRPRPPGTYRASQP